MAGTSCVSCLLRNRSLFTPFTDEELEFMESFKTGEMTVAPGTTLLLEGSNSPQLFTVLSGMGVRYTTMQNGRRQVINFLLPGDFIGLQAGIFGEMKHSVEATTAMTLCAFRRDDLWRLFRQNPARAYDLTWIAAVEEHFLGETISSLGQRDAVQRIAWAFVRIFERLKATGMVRAGRVPLPFRQQDLADALGLSLVHTNKTLKVLRSTGLARWSHGELEIGRMEELAEIAMIELEKPQQRPLM